MYIFVRTDLPQPQQVVQSCHAVFEVARNMPACSGHPSMVVLGVKNETQLQKVQDKMNQHGIEFRSFYEPLFDNSLTAISSVPLSEDQRKIFKNYQLLKAGG